MAFTVKTDSLPISNTSAVFIATNPVLLYGQVARETDVNRTKVGDGFSTYTQLTYQEIGHEIVEATGVDTYVGTFGKPFFIAYFPMQRIRVRFASANTGASTINLSGLGAKAIKKTVSAALVAGDILAGGIYELVYDGTNFQMINVSSTGAVAGTQWLLLGNSGTVDGTNFLGTIDNIPLTFRVNNVASGRIDHTLFNAFYGYQAGVANTYARYNVAIGEMALLTQSFSNVNVAWDSFNTAVGYEALKFNQPTNTGTGVMNVALGARALRGNTTGKYNIGIGFQALIANTTGDASVGIGYLALTNTTSAGSIAIGFQAGYSNTTGSMVAVGYNALSLNVAGANNTAVGIQALLNSSYAGQNVAIGTNALGGMSYTNANTAWLTDNIAIGHNALVACEPSSNTNGYRNIAIGTSALLVNTTGSFQVAIGYEALKTILTSNNNTAVGYQALKLTTATSSTAVGYQALGTLSGGSRSTAVGYAALYTCTSGDYNTAIGYGADCTANNLSYCIAIGADALAGASNAAVIGAAAALGSGGVQVGINMTTPAAFLHLPAGTATTGQAPLKFTSGINLTTASAGAMEYNGTNLFFTRAGTVRENVLIAVDNAAAPATNTIGIILDYYGISATRVLTTPDSWLSVNILGTVYKMALYL